MSSQTDGSVATAQAAVVDAQAHVVAAVERLVDDFTAEAGAELRRLDPGLDLLVTAARDAVLAGGKRVRPTFAYWGWRSVAGPDQPVEPVLPALAALELLHAFALVHDDVMDRSPTRRGRPTTHEALVAAHRAATLTGSATHFGQSGAILVGDLCLVWADQLLAATALPGDAVVAVRHEYDLMRVRTAAGQFLDILGEVSPGWPVDRTRAANRLKTAHYTVVGPLRYGLALGRATRHAAGQVDDARGARDAALDEVYTRYGLAVGEAFQLRDDLLGAYGDPTQTGKPVGEDLSRGKPTVLLHTARQLANPSQRAALEDALARAPRADPRRLAELIAATGAVDHVERIIAARTRAAVRALDTAPVPDTVRAALTALAQAIPTRTR